LHVQPVVVRGQQVLEDRRRLGVGPAGQVVAAGVGPVQVGEVGGQPGGQLGVAVWSSPTPWPRLVTVAVLAAVAVVV
jgi:hypothetical protein